MVAMYEKCTRAVTFENVKTLKKQKSSMWWLYMGNILGH